jgi:hypothetical protein
VLLDLPDGAVAALDKRREKILDTNLTATDDGRAILPVRHATVKDMLRAALVDYHVRPALDQFPTPEMAAAQEQQASLAKAHEEILLAALGMPATSGDGGPVGVGQAGP